MKKGLRLMTMLTLAISLVGCGGGDGGNSDGGNSDTLKIGIIQYAEHPALDKTKDGFIEGLKEAGYEEGKDYTLDFQIAQGERANCDTIADKFVNDNVDLVYAIATPAAQAVAQKTTDTPIVVAAVTDPKESGLVASNEAPGGNITGASDLTPVKDQIDLLTSIVPDAKTVAVMYCGSEDNSIFQAKLAEEAITAKGLTYRAAAVSDSSTIQQVAESLVGNVDAIYIPTDNLLAEYMTTVANVTNENNIPCIVGEEGMALNGGLATYGIDYHNLGVKAGEQAAQILKGEKKAGEIPVAYLSIEDCTLLVNKKVAEQIGVTVPQDILDKAELIGEE